MQSHYAEIVCNRVENDVKLLRNRVRMLQQEHAKAQKKIQETAKKTDELVILRKKNDENYERRQQIQEKRQQEAKNSSQFAYQEQKMRR